MSDFLKIESISQLHRMLGYDKPRHPLITVIDYSQVKNRPEHFNVKIVVDFYVISLKSPAPVALQYGRQYYDFDEGTMLFMAPGQVFSVQEFNEDSQYDGWGLYFHPDLLVQADLGRRMKEYTFFSYAVSEALHVSEDEQQTLSVLVDTIRKEYSSNLDVYSQRVIVTAIEQLLNYAQRFYGRQFLTRQKFNTDLISRFEALLAGYFARGQQTEQGLPAVEYLAAELHLSPSYLTDLLKRETGKTTKEYIQTYVIEQAKLRLLNSTETVNEIAYGLGFDYPQYFNRLFKAKTGMTPVEYRTLN
ncbi:transcriptional regulator, AraC family [Fibrisoma limi BUZ 3]|uniref:Transcriptional regulator, AraC family n=1 Tax=Fibrisoma limi BUZ 3 TaxID=1185876 RepID=I2GGA4_9BACT|nr:response regulator transcription factor [Fibrisoma limi]CCH52929.1 transcriptional regulator, AraC family [Fibrisoma limi BUZ 3]